MIKNINEIQTPIKSEPLKDSKLGIDLQFQVPYLQAVMQHSLVW